MKFIQVPIDIYNKELADLGLKEEDCSVPATLWLNLDRIEAIREGHDDHLGETPLNTEATVVHLMNGEQFLVYMHINEFVELLKVHSDIHFL